MYQINLLPSQEKKETRKKIGVTVIFSSVLLLSVLVIFILNTQLAHQVDKLNATKNSLVKQLAVPSVSEKELSMLKDRENSLQAISQQLRLNAQRLRKMIAIVKDLDLFISADFFINAIEYQSAHFSLLVYTKSEKLLLILLPKIEKKYHCKINQSYAKKYNKGADFILTIKL